MSRILNTRALERELVKRNLVPDNCRLLEVRIEPGSALVVRYEVFVSTERLGLFADALKAAADAAVASDERNRIAREGEA